jgi:general secretion pathway protein N
MKLPWRPIAFGMVAFLVFLGATLPADIVLTRLQSHGIAAAGISGSIWNGRAGVLQIGNTALGATTWRLNVLPLFTGRLSADVNVNRDDGSMRTQFSIGFGKRVELRSLQGKLPIAALGGLGLPGGWQGDVRIQLTALDLESNWPTRVVGSIDATNLVGPANQPTALGNFRVDFADKAAKTEGIVGTLVSVGEGPLDVAGTLRLMPNRTYTIDAQVATRASAPASIAQALQYLGPPDAQGKRPLSMSGSL